MEQNLRSQKLDRTIDIDGKGTEWAGAEAYYDAKEGYKIGFFNDEEYLYLYIATWNKSTRRSIIENGLRLKFEGQKQGKHFFAISYPMGFSMQKPEALSKEGYMEPHGGRTRNAILARERTAHAPDSAEFFGLPDIASRTALLQSDRAEDSLLACPSDSAGIGIKAMLLSSGRLTVIEMRLPLDPSGEFPYAIPARSGDTIEITFETASPKRRGPFDARTPFGEPSQDENLPPMGGFGQPMGARPGMGPPSDFTKGIYLRAKVELAR